MKKGLLAGITAAMLFGGLSASVNSTKQVTPSAVRNTRIIVEVNKKVGEVSRDEIFASQDKVLKSIQRSINSQAKLVERYCVLNNAFVVEVNNEDIEAIEALEGVASVTRDKLHAQQDISDGSGYSAQFIRPTYDPSVEGTDTMVENISAKTMNKPAGTNDGEGTVIAILDNEFYFRGDHEEAYEIPNVGSNYRFESLADAENQDKSDWPTVGTIRVAPAGATDEEASYYTWKKETNGTVTFSFKDTHDDGTPWKHAVFKPLGNDVSQKFTWDNLFNNANSVVSVDKEQSSVIAETEEEEFYSTHAYRISGKNPGEEGSCYFNTKVPFYFDYGGETTKYSSVGPFDHDVSSTLSYHGSHVASIAAANADYYKGIAPKAQLACMKVFTTYISNDTGEQMGFQTSSGAYDSAILSALEDCITLGVDGINMSLGSNLDDFDSRSITMQTLQRLANDENILSAISAGNAGKMSYSFTGGYGNWTTDMVETGILGSYANSTDNMIIASGQPTEIYYERAFELFDSNGDPIKNVAYEDQVVNREGIDADYSESDQRWMVDIITDKSTGTKDFEKEIEWVYIPGFGAATDYAGLDVSNKVAVVNRGSTSFADKYSVAANKGASAIVIINNDPTATDFNFRCSFGEGFQSRIPCALALYRDKPTFEENKSGKFKFIEKRVSTNDLAKTISTYSTDGARFDYSLKPDITTPGENIRGAVPPQKSDDRINTPYATYEYLSGTSMAAPNYAGAQSVLVSQKAKAVYAPGHTATPAELAELKAYKKTVDLRLMSTADPMVDSTRNPEDGTAYLSDGKTIDESKSYYSFTSPRQQGAGLVNIGKAIDTHVYLDGLDDNGNRIYKSKIQLHNNDDVASGKLKLSFMAINEGEQETYKAKVTVMRPAIAKNNKVLSKEYSDKGELDSLERIPGLAYVVEDYVSGVGYSTKMKVNDGTGYKKNDVIKLTKQLEYYSKVQDGKNKLEDYDKSELITLEPGFYYNTLENGCKWEPLPDYAYQSIQDVVIDTFERDVVVPANASTKINLSEYVLSDDVKNDIMSKFPYGCALEGFVELQQEGETKLSMPYLGFFSNKSNEHPENTLEKAPVVEPFSFEKDPSTIYESDLVNDVAKQLVGKESVSYGSTWTVGYAETTMDIDTDTILTNDGSFVSMKNFHEVGLNPTTGEYFDNPEQNIFVGNPEKTNTMIIHQFVLRSVKDNNFVIKDKDGNQIYKSALKDMLFGSSAGTALYKSHVDSNYLSAGYVAHRASAIIPLYNQNTHKPFADGEYTITFNYQLQYNGSWVSKTYNFIIDSTAPEITNVVEYTQDNVQRVRIEVKDRKVCSAIVGYENASFSYDAEKDVYYLDNTKEYFDTIMDDLDVMSNGQRRLFLQFQDGAYGESTAILHFFGSSYSNYVVAQGSGLTAKMDFLKDGQDIKWYEINRGRETEITLSQYIKVTTNIVDPIDEEANGIMDKAMSLIGCKGSVVVASSVVSIAATLGGCLIATKKRKGKNEEEK